VGHLNELFWEVILLQADYFVAILPAVSHTECVPCLEVCDSEFTCVFGYMGMHMGRVQQHREKISA
jgi:hypothetical protein